jgi:hypothetical protein
MKPLREYKRWTNYVICKSNVMGSLKCLDARPTSRVAYDAPIHLLKNTLGGRKTPTGETRLIHSFVSQRKHHAAIFTPTVFFATTIYYEIPDLNSTFAPTGEHVKFALF